MVIRRWIGRRERAEAALAATLSDTPDSLNLIEMLLSRAPIGLGFVDRDLRRVWVNEALAQYNGLTVDAQIGRRVPDLVPTLWPQMEPCYRKVLDHGEAVLDVEVTGPNEADPDIVRHWRNSYYPVILDGEVVGVGVVAVDISELKQAVQTQRHLAAIVENSGEAIFSSSLDGVATSWNAAAERLFGYSADEIVGRPLSLLTTAGNETEPAEIRARIATTGRTVRRETVRRRKDGSVFDVLMTASPSTDEHGAVVGLAVIAQDITKRMRAQQDLQASQRRLAEAQRIAQVGSFEVDLATGEVIWSDELRRILGVEPTEQPSVEKIFSMVHADDRPVLARGRADAVERGVPFEVVYRMNRGDAEQRWVHTRGVPEPAEPGMVTKLAGTVEDITDRVEAERIRREAEERFETAFEQAGVGAAILNLEGLRTRVNAAASTILGRPREQLLHRTWDEFQHPDDVEFIQATRARGLVGAATHSDERRYIRPDGSIVWVLMNLAAVRSDDGPPQYYVAQFHDITERKSAEAELAHLALHDALTGLANRALLTDRLNHALATTRRRDERLAVIFLDLDQFKIVNDSLGHGVGDELLRQVATRIKLVIRESDTVARFGGDEFVIVCDESSIAEVEQIAARVQQTVSRPYFIAQQEIGITASLGIAVADRHATTESLLRDSDTAMYSAKEHGRDRMEIFDEALRAGAEARMATATALRRALKNDEFVVHYQPVFDLVTGEMTSAEALVRWAHPKHGLIGPADFIPVAEDTGLITSIGTLVLEQACLQLVEWQRIEPAMSIAVNLSVRQILADDVVGNIEGILKRTNVSPGSVHLELTESVLMGDVAYFEKTLTALKNLGVHLSIDDFGTGYSSLSYLQRFPVDTVKIDRVFVEGLGADRHNTALVAAILAMADALELSVIAEGIETDDQMQLLKHLGCRQGQGFHLARPMAGDAVTSLLMHHHQGGAAG
jgi:diguanylate cyclase (GGDEF)-like protein/PAS domain S-box-containing protein